MLKPFHSKGQVEAGCDEAGRGCLSGPVVASAVILPSNFKHALLNDSKQLTHKQRKFLEPIIKEKAISWAIGVVSPQEIDEFAIVGGISAIHQFVKIGSHVMISGGSLVRKDVPPYIKVAKEPLSFIGINSIGLSRKGFNEDKILEIQNIYRAIFQSNMNYTKAIETIEQEFPQSKEKDNIIKFISESERGIIKGYKK